MMSHIVCQDVGEDGCHPAKGHTDSATTVGCVTISVEVTPNSSQNPPSFIRIKIPRVFSRHFGKENPHQFHGALFSPSPRGWGSVLRIKVTYTPENEQIVP